MSDDADYHRARAEQELAQAAHAHDRAAAKIHLELAKCHLRATGNDESHTLFDPLE